MITGLYAFTFYFTDEAAIQNTKANHAYFVHHENIMNMVNHRWTNQSISTQRTCQHTCRSLHLCCNHTGGSLSHCSCPLQSWEAGLPRTAAPHTVLAPGQSGHSGYALSAAAATCASGPGRSLTVVPSVAGRDGSYEHGAVTVHG